MLRLARGSLFWAALAALAVGQGGRSKNDQDPPPGLAVPRGVTLRVARSEMIRAGSWLRPAPGPDGVILLEGLQGVTLDLSGVTLKGRSEPLALDWCAGRGLVLRDCQDVTVRGGTLTGYETCVLAVRCSGLTIADMTFDGYRAQHLRSTVAIESEEDVLIPPTSAPAGWDVTQGSAIRLEDCTDVAVSGCTARRGQNGLLAQRCQRGTVFDNDFSFLSGWGLGLLDCEGFAVSNNRVDFCLRGFSRGFYASGQGSAGILLLGAGGGHVVANNSVVGSGTGLVIRTGGMPASEPSHEDGLRILVYGNDFSGAATDGIDAEGLADTWIVGNKIEDTGSAGIRAVGAERVVVGDNVVRGVPGAALALTDVRDLTVVRNVVHESEVGLEVWTSEDTPGGGAAGTAAGDSSRVWVDTNSFAGNDIDLGLRDVRALRLVGNVHDLHGRTLLTGDLTADPETPPLVLQNRDPESGEELDSRLELRDWLRGIGGWLPSGHIVRCELRWPGFEAPAARDALLSFRRPDVPGTPPADRGPERPPVRKVVGEWGPWDFEREPQPARLRQPGGRLQGARWHAAWFRWSEEQDPRGGVPALERWRALSETAVLRGEVDTWATPWGPNGDRRRVVGEERFGLVATTRVELESGRYRLTALADDGVRMLVDGRVVVEDWTWHSARATAAEIELTAGSHEVVLEYFQIDGPAVLTIDLDRLTDEE